MTRQEAAQWIAFANTDVQVRAAHIAHEIHQTVAALVVGTATQVLNEDSPETDQDALLRAAFAWKANEALAAHLLISGAGWCEDFYTTLRRLDQEG